MVAGDGADDVVDSVVVVVVRGVKRWNGLRVSFGLKNGLRVDTGLDPPVLCVSCCRVVSLAVVKAEGDVVLLDVVHEVEVEHVELLALDATNEALVAHVQVDLIVLLTQL